MQVFEEIDTYKNCNEPTFLDTTLDSQNLRKYMSVAIPERKYVRPSRLLTVRYSL